MNKDLIDEINQIVSRQSELKNRILQNIAYGYCTRYMELKDAEDCFKCWEDGTEYKGPAIHPWDPDWDKANYEVFPLLVTGCFLGGSVNKLNPPFNPLDHEQTK